MGHTNCIEDYQEVETAVFLQGGWNEYVNVSISYILDI